MGGGPGRKRIPRDGHQGKKSKRQGKWEIEAGKKRVLFTRGEGGAPLGSWISKGGAKGKEGELVSKWVRQKGSKKGLGGGAHKRSYHLNKEIRGIGRDQTEGVGARRGVLNDGQTVTSQFRTKKDLTSKCDSWCRRTVETGSVGKQNSTRGVFAILVLRTEGGALGLNC